MKIRKNFENKLVLKILDINNKNFIVTNVILKLYIFQSNDVNKLRHR